MVFTYSDDLIPEEARENLEKLGKVVATFLLVCGIKSAVSYAVDVSKGEVSPTDQKPPKEMTPANLDVTTNKNAVDPRPTSPSVLVSQPYLPPTDSVACNPFFVGVGVVSLAWTSVAAFFLNDKR